MNKFNDTVSLAQNIRSGLWVNGKTINDMTSELQIQKQNISVAISRKFKRNNNITPQDKRMIIYLLEHCDGFKAWTKQNNITIDS